MTTEEYYKSQITEKLNDKYREMSFYDRTVMIMADFVRLKCKEQREICSNNAKVESGYLPSKDKIQYDIDTQSILNSPEPEL